MCIPARNINTGTCLKTGFALLLAQLASGCATPPASEPPARPSTAPHDTAAGARWLDRLDQLDRPPANWNQRMSPLPRPVTFPADEQLAQRCRTSLRQPIGPAEHALARAGWKLYGIVRSYDQTQIITALSGVDGMCRPLGYQAFVYWEGRYAGTLAPQAMDSRTDGALADIRLESPTRIVAQFLRYSSADPLCCPSRSSRVTYEVSRDDAPLVTPAGIVTQPAGSQ